MRKSPAAVATLALLAVAACARPAQGVDAAADSREIVIAATTDVHGRLRGWDYYADAVDSLHGLARAASIVDSLRAAHPGRVLLVDAGDLLQGNPLAFVAARVSADTSSPILAAMNAMRYDAAVIGNHEFNYGLSHLERAIGQARFPFLAANAWRVDGGRAYTPHVVVERAGVRVGIVGVTTPGAMVWDRDHLRGHIEIRDIVPETRRAVAEARTSGADVVVVVAHAGLDGATSYDTAGTGMGEENPMARVAREVAGIDLIVIGHSHREIADTTIGGVLIVQPRNWARSVAVATLRVVRAPEGWRVSVRRGELVQTRGWPESPAVLAASERAHRETIAYVTTPIGSTPVTWRADSARIVDTPIIDLINEVQRRASGADLSSSVAFSLGARLGPGPITVAQLARLYPYDNTLRAVRIDGRQLREYLEYSARYYRSVGDERGQVDRAVPGYNFDILSGADYTIDLSRPLGSRITRLERNGRPVADADTFTLALNNYRQTGGGGYEMLRDAPVVYDRQEEIRQLLIDEVRRRGTIRPQEYFTPNWRLEPADAAERAYTEMNRSPGPPAAPGAPAPGAPASAP